MASRKISETHPVTSKAFKQHCRRLFPERGWRRMMVTVWYPDDDPIDGYRSGGQKAKVVGPKTVVNLAFQYYYNEGLYRYTDKVTGPDGKTEEKWVARLPKTAEEVVRMAEDEGDGYGSTYLVEIKTYRAQEEERERKACEGLAAEICGKYNVKGGTLKFVAAVHRHYGRLIRDERYFREDPEYKMERYATCMANGCREGYWQDNDYSSELEGGYRESLDRLIRYLQKYQPLLWGRWEERKRKKK